MVNWLGSIRIPNFYKNTGKPLIAADAIVRCDDTANNCADYLLSAAEAAGGIYANDSFSAPTGFVSPILDHGDYQVTFSSNTLNFAVSGNTITP